MKTICKQIIEIPIGEVIGIEKLFGRTMKMDINDIPKKFKNNYCRSREDSYNNFTIKSIYESFEVVEFAKDKIILENGILIENKIFSEVFCGSSELLFCVVGLKGYEYLEEVEDDMIYKLFLDSWGTAFVEKAYEWMKNEIASTLVKDKLYTTHSFSPGQNDIPIEMQRLIFEYLEPSRIGVTLNDSLMMYPKKTISGIIGISSCNSKDRMRPCDLCERKLTCNLSYVNLEK